MKLDDVVLKSFVGVGAFIIIACTAALIFLIAFVRALWHR